MRFSMRRLVVLLTCFGVVAAGLVGTTPTAAAVGGRLTNLAHLNFLLDQVAPGAVPGHTTYRLADQPELTVPWTYANALPGGGFERVGGGAKDPQTGYYSQGAFNADDISRSAVVYLRDWRQTGSAASRRTAYQLLRAVAYLQTSSGPNAGNVVLWMQPDGTLNRSAIPKELPDPSDSDASYWLARAIWAYGEGYSAFRRVDPAFARFLASRLRLAVSALNRETLNRYGHYDVADGRRVPAWLIVDGADASAEASLGLAAYVAALPRDAAPRRALAQLTDGIAQLARGNRRSWPYGAILPWTQSPSMWHAWSSQMAAALARSAAVLGERRLLAPALRQATSFDSTLLIAGGPDNGWYPAPVDTTQIAYGVDSQVQSLLAVADDTGSAGVADLAGLTAGWYFGTNRSRSPVYDPTTGVTFDGVAPDGTVNRNSGAESTIHGLLSMLALDAHPRVRAIATSVTGTVSRDGLRMVEAETASATTGTVVTPASPWTGESQYSGGKYLALRAGQRATLSVGAEGQRRELEPVVFLRPHGPDASRWTAAGRVLGSVGGGVGAQGITAVPGALLPRLLPRELPAGVSTVTVTARRGEVDLDGVLVRPVLSRATYRGPAGSSSLVQFVGRGTGWAALGAPGQRTRVAVFDAVGQTVRATWADGLVRVAIPSGGFAVSLPAGI